MTFYRVNIFLYLSLLERMYFGGRGEHALLIFLPLERRFGLETKLEMIIIKYLH